MIRRVWHRVARGTVQGIVRASLVRRACRWPAFRKLFFDASNNFTPFVVAQADGRPFMVRSDDLMVSRGVFVEGGFEADVLPRVLSILDRRGYGRVRERAFVDIGANIGTAVVKAVAAHGFARGIAFEPEPTNQKLIRVNAILNGVDDRVTLHAVALSDRQAQLVFELADANSGDGRVRVAEATGVKDIGDESGRQTISVPGERFDDLVDRGVVNVDDVGMVWMDAQGHEGHILSGASRLLERDVPILTEYWPYALARAGGQELFERAVREHFTHFINLRDPVAGGGGEPEPRPVADVASLRERYTGWANTDLLLIKRLG